MKTGTLITMAASAGLALLLLAGAAQAATVSVDDNLGRIERILDDVDRAKEIITGRPSGSTDVARAQERLRAREADLERARVDAMASAAGVSRDKVISLRAQGRSWGSIARDLGVSLRVVGIDGRHGDDEQGGKYWNNQGKHKGWKDGMPPGQAKKRGYDD
ncbi:MAG TPA: hypothetical protein VN419_09470 [Humidesulfovibrio sp.]|uniref:hypothetical protein n=1 Tax=Humidesulfovibrio sp. TaxID=2910988 RepID=UPI002C2A788F|nr:hypothetical protein [Humidesulfovibrio sp.]HWR04237.1 hypothetical protein [Humidesulfovibrio sp.]